MHHGSQPPPSLLLPLPYVVPYLGVKKTSVYLGDREARRLDELARSEGRSRAELIRAAISSYVPPGRGDAGFALARGFTRIDGDPRPISEIPESELLEGFGE